jgi:hypothetical protein
MSELAVNFGHMPLEIHLAANWEISDIKSWLFNVTRDEKYRIFWDEFFENHL